MDTLIGGSLDWYGHLRSSMLDADGMTHGGSGARLFAVNFHCQPSVLMVDELLSAYPHQLSFSEAGMRIMITSHFSPRTRLTMASRMLINEVGSYVTTAWQHRSDEKETHLAFSCLKYFFSFTFDETKSVNF